MSFLDTIKTIINSGRDSLKEVAGDKVSYRKSEPLDLPKESVSSYSPMARAKNYGLGEKPKTQFGAFNTPTPVLPTDTRTSTPSDTIKNPVDVIAGVAKGGMEVAKFGKEFLQDTARAVASAGITAGNLPFQATGNEGPFQSEIQTAGNPVTEAVFGGKPIGDIKTYGEKGRQFIKELTGKEIDPRADYALGIAGVALNLSGGKKKFVEEIAKSKDSAFIIKTLLKEKPVFSSLPNNDLADFGELLAKTEDPKEVNRLINKAEGMVAPQTSITPEVAQATSKTTPRIERAYSKRAAEMMPENEKIGSSYATRRSTEQLAQKAQNLIKEDPEETARIIDEIKEGGKGTQIGEKHIAVASEMLNKLSREAEMATDTLTKNKLYDDAAELANATAKRLTQLGRDVQAASILQRLTPEGQVRFAAREIQKFNLKNPTKKIPELSGEQAKIIADKMRDIKNMPEGTERSKKFFELQEYVKQQIPTPELWKKVTSVWKAGLLTGLKTSGLNIASNTTHYGMEQTAKQIASGVDKAISLFTGKRTITAGFGGGAKGFKEGFNRGVEYFKSGFDERNIGEKLDYNKINFGKGPVAKAFQTYTETVFRAIGAQDQPFYYGTLSQSLYDQAKAQAKNLGLKGAEFTKKVEELVQDPTEEMIRYGTLDATTAVFQNKTALGAAAKKMQEIPYVGQFVVPFAQTPSAVAMQIINYSPVGLVKTIIENARKGKFDQRLFAQGIGRGIVGTAPLFIGAELYKNGLISLDYPQGDERMIELNKAEGQSYNSVKIGNDWRGLNVLGPAGQLVLLGAYFQKALDETGSPSQAITVAFSGAVGSFSEQTFLSGAKNAMDAISDPGQYAADYLPNLVASFIPTIVSDVARSSDGMERNSKGKGFIDTFRTKAMARTPGLRGNLEPQISSLGGEIPLGGNVIETMLDPTRTSEIRSTIVTSELRRLQNAGFKVAPTKVGKSEGYKSLSPEEDTLLYKTVGTLVNEKLTKLFEHENYAQLGDAKKEEKIKQFVDKAKIVGRAKFVALMLDGLSKEDRATLLKKYKSDGLLTEQVFTEYKKLISE